MLRLDETGWVIQYVRTLSKARQPMCMCCAVTQEFLFHSRPCLRISLRAHFFSMLMRTKVSNSTFPLKLHMAAIGGHCSRSRHSSFSTVTREGCVSLY